MQDVLDIDRAHAELEKAEKSNPGPWTDHSKYAALACQNIAQKCPHLDPVQAYILGLMHDIGRHVGVTSNRHLVDGYHYCMHYGWDKAAQICVTHAFIIKDIHSLLGTYDMTPQEFEWLKAFVENVTYDDYDLLVQLCDKLAMPTGFCLIEKRFVDVALRYGTQPIMVPRWKRIYEIKDHFEKIMGCSIYDVLPGVVENSMRISF